MMWLLTIIEIKVMLKLSIQLSRDRRLIVILFFMSASVHYYSNTFDMILRASKSQAHLSASYMLLGRTPPSFTQVQTYRKIFIFL